MGSAASSAGRAGRGAAPLPDNDWVLENVLFFDPQQQAAAGGGRHDCTSLHVFNRNHTCLGLAAWRRAFRKRARLPAVRLCFYASMLLAALASYTKPTVKRFTPSRAKLRNRNFRVFFVLEGRRQEFLLKLVNDPACRILLCDRAGRELKEILTSRIKYMQRQDVVRVG